MPGRVRFAQETMRGCWLFANGAGISSCAVRPGKINLFLHVTGRREDGYHELQTLFQLIDYTDCLTIEPREDDRFEYADDADGAFAGTNLCLRAAELARSRHPEGCGATIFLNKRISVGAGLGGGSSDAAAVLHGLNRLWGPTVGNGGIGRDGAGAGSGCAAVRIRAHCMGGRRGEKLTPVDRPRDLRWYCRPRRRSVRPRRTGPAIDTME